jgi:hypothetical protein
MVILYIYSTCWRMKSTFYECQQCLSGNDLTGYDFFNVTKDGFMLMSVQVASEAWLGDVVFQ